MLKTLYGRLALSFLVLLSLLGVAVLWVAQSTSNLYSQEVTQRLNRNIAMYVTAQDDLIEGGQVNQLAMDELANHAMTINPSAEIYLLDADGRILTHLLPPDSVHLAQLSLAPVQAFLQGDAQLPLMGDDPRNPGLQKVFSVSPVYDNGELAGYLYAVLGGEKYESLRSAVADSYILQVGVFAIIATLALTLVSALGIFFLLTRRLGQLRSQVEVFRTAPSPAEAVLAPGPTRFHDEIDDLGVAFQEMARHIQQQFHALQSLDATRRELVANVSHDLRTPLASMQGYIETLLIKDEQLDPAERRKFLTIAHKHSERLNRLIAELFELAKLDAGAVEPNMEDFSLLELVHDCVQESAWQAEQGGVLVSVDSALTNCHVVADIALIQRVLQNLLDNAIHHTPRGNTVTVRVADTADSAVIEVSDTGQGIATHEIPHIFERFYQSQQEEPAHKIGAGLGLAIVKKILDLHEATIAVRSEGGLGTRFTFELPLQVA